MYLASPKFSTHNVPLPHAPKPHMAGPVVPNIPRRQVQKLSGPKKMSREASKTKNKTTRIKNKSLHYDFFLSENTVPMAAPKFHRKPSFPPLK